VTGDLALSAAAHCLRLDYFERSGGLAYNSGGKDNPLLPGLEGRVLVEFEILRLACPHPNDKRLTSIGGPPHLPRGCLRTISPVRWSRTMKFDAGIYRSLRYRDDGIRIKVDAR
jgi:hypothetical protein